MMTRRRLFGWLGAVLVAPFGILKSRTWAVPSVTPWSETLSGTWDDSESVADTLAQRFVRHVETYGPWEGDRVEFDLTDGSIWMVDEDLEPLENEDEEAEAAQRVTDVAWFEMDGDEEFELDAYDRRFADVATHVEFDLINTQRTTLQL